MKDSYWFRHDSNARNDEKIIDLRAELGYEGYGIFWALIEFLRDSSHYEAEYKPKRIAYAIQADESFIEQVINGYGLFVVEHEKFYSNSLKERMREMDRKRKQQRDKANKRWGKDIEHSDLPEQAEEERLSHGNAMALPEQYHKIKEENIRKEKKRDKEKRRAKTAEVVNRFPDFLPKPGMLEFLLNKHKVVDPEVFFQCFFFQIGSLPIKKWEDTELENAVTNGFAAIYSKGLGSDDRSKSFEYFAVYGFNLSPEEAKSEVNRFNKKPDQKSDSLMLFSEHLLDKQKKPSGILLKLLDHLRKKKTDNNGLLQPNS